MRATIESAIEALIAMLDKLDGDPDLELCCEDEGVDADSEPDAPPFVVDYADDGHGGQDQMRLISIYGPTVFVHAWGAR